MRQRLLLLAAAAALSACGAAVQQPAPPPTPPSLSAAQPASTVSQTPGALLPPIGVHEAPPHADLSRPVTTYSVCGDWPSGGPPTLGQLLSDVAPTSKWSRAAAVVTVVSAGAPFYNTPDRARWTQAWISAGHYPYIYTPYVFRVQRPLAPGLSAGQTIAAYVEGGAMANGDDMRFCTGQPSATPSAGSQAVVIFGGGNIRELPLGPTVSLFDVIEGGSVVTYRGREPIP
jgi:hypothetical protein